MIRSNEISQIKIPKRISFNEENRLRNLDEPNFTITEAMDSWKDNYNEYQNHKKNEKPLDFDGFENEYKNMQFDFPDTKEEAIRQFNNAMQKDALDKFAEDNRSFINNIQNFSQSNQNIYKKEIPKIFTKHLKINKVEEILPSGSFRHGTLIYMEYPGKQKKVVQTFKGKEFMGIFSPAKPEKMHSLRVLWTLENIFRDFFYDVLIKRNDFVIERIQETYEDHIPDSWSYKYYFQVRFIDQ